MSKVLTIVVPSYNTKAHVDKCIPTMIDENFINDIEILLINDGSTDETESMLMKYALMHPQSIRVISKKNGGHGSVVNKGIEEATGKYFRVIDGDDPVITRNLGELVNKLKIIDADIVFTPFYEEFVESGKRKPCFFTRLEDCKIYPFDSVCNMIECLPLHSINYRTSLLKENKIRVQEGCFYEDKEYDLYPIPYVKSIAYVNEPVYIYRIGVPGQSISVEKVLRNRKMLETITHNLCLFYEDVLEQGTTDDKKRYLSNAICDVIKNMYGMFLKMPFGKTSFSEIGTFNTMCKQWSGILYKESNKGAIMLLRKNNILLYSLVFFGFKLKRRFRGF